MVQGHQRWLRLSGNQTGNVRTSSSRNPGAKTVKKRLKDKGYKQSRLNPGFGTHTTCPIYFTLFADYFGVKYVCKEHAQHLMGVLEEHYTISHGWKGKLYLGIDLDWDYAGRKVNLSILLYVKEVLIRFNHAMPRRLQDQPQPHIKPKYVQIVQYT